jgi:hypothetical protein
MKSISILQMILATTLIATLSGCLEDKCEREVTYIRVDPVFKTFQEIKSTQVRSESPRELESPGKIYFYNNLIFINEKREGVHIIDNSQPSNPVKIKFLSIPGNDDIAVRNGILYANSYIDLLAIDLKDYQVKGRAEGVFKPLWVDLANNRVAVYYEESKVTENMDCQTFGTLIQRGGVFWGAGPEFAGNLPSVVDKNSSSGSSSSSGSGIGGSMARFTIVGPYMYVVDESSLHVFDLIVQEKPNKINTVAIGWGIETIIPYKDKLFVGSNSGMFIFDNQNPVKPVMLSSFQHARACDPVFVQDNYAYVTLRSGTRCEGFNNQLDLIDITDLKKPFLVKTFPMDNPHGLSIKDKILLLCEGKFGFKTFDITDPKILGDKLLDHEKSPHSYDVISLPGDKNIAMVIGEDGFYQFDFSDPKNLKLISKVPIGN